MVATAILRKGEVNKGNTGARATLRDAVAAKSERPKTHHLPVPRRDASDHATRSRHWLRRSLPSICRRRAGSVECSKASSAPQHVPKLSTAIGADGDGRSDGLEAIADGAEGRERRKEDVDLCNMKEEISQSVKGFREREHTSGVGQSGSFIASTSACFLTLTPTSWVISRVRPARLCVSRKLKW